MTKCVDAIVSLLLKACAYPRLVYFLLLLQLVFDLVHSGSGTSTPVFSLDDIVFTGCCQQSKFAWTIQLHAIHQGLTSTTEMQLLQIKVE